MTDNKTIGINTLISIGLILTASLTSSYFDTPKYYCESESSILECESISGGAGNRCYLNVEKNSWDYCSSGWLLVDNDLNVQDFEVNDSIYAELNPITGIKYLCNNTMCIEVKE